MKHENKASMDALFRLKNGMLCALHPKGSVGKDSNRD